MFRRITLLIPVLVMLSLSGCIIFPHGGGHGGHRYYDGGGPGYYNGGGPGYYNGGGRGDYRR